MDDCVKDFFRENQSRNRQIGELWSRWRVEYNDCQGHGDEVIGTAPSRKMEAVAVDF